MKVQKEEYFYPLKGLVEGVPPVRVQFLESLREPRDLVLFEAFELQCRGLVAHLAGGECRR